MAYEAYITKINESYYIIELIPKSSTPEPSVVALLMFGLLLTAGLAAYIYRREYKLKKESLELRKRLVSVLERLEKKLEEDNSDEKSD